MSRTTAPALGVSEVHTSRKEALEVIGMSGIPTSQCGSSIPIVRSVDDGSFHVITREGLPVWHDASELEMQVVNELLCIFAHPLPFDQLQTKPVILFATRQFLNLIGIQLPKKIGELPCQWTTVKKTSAQTFAICVPQTVAVQWLNTCAETILKKFDQMIIGAQQESVIDRETLCQWALIALCATSHRPLRFRLLVRYGSVMASQQLQHLFDSTVTKEFKTVTRQNFEQRATTFASRLRQRPVLV